MTDIFASSFTPTAAPKSDIFSTSLDPAMQQASARLSTSGDNPEQASKAIEIGNHFDIPPQAVDQDFDHFEKVYGQGARAAIVGENPALVQYINSHPMAASVSKDDLPQMAESSKATSALGHKGFIENTGDVLKSVWKGVVSGPEQYRDISNSSKDFLLKMGVPPDVAEREAQNISRSAWRNEEITNLLWALPTAAFSPLVGAFRTYFSQPLERQTGFPAEATEGLAMAAAGFLGLKPGLEGAAKLTETAKKAEPYVRAGEAPPVGLDEVTDKLHIEQAKQDQKALGEALKAATKTQTRELAPELFADFQRQHTDGDIGVSADAIRALYGDKVPAPDDGLLGWVPRLQEQLSAAETIGGDVRIPVADWLAKVEPDVAKALEDHVRVREGGLTPEEAKELVPSQQESIASSAITMDDGAIFTGPTHGDAYNEASKAGYDVSRLAKEDGFITNTGRYIDRDEALRVAQDAGQFATDEELTAAGYDPKGLVSEDLTSQTRRSLRKAYKLQQLEMPEATRMEDRQPFTGPPPGFTKEMYRRYLDLIAQRRAEDADALAKRALEFQRKTQTQEWKAQQAEMRPTIKDRIEARPEVELDQQLRANKLKIRGGPEYLELLPRQWMSDKGVDIDDLAAIFGADSGKDLAERLVNHVYAREQSGMKPDVYLKHLIDSETDRQMMEKYGDLDKRIIDDAKDQVLSETQEEILHQETMARALEAGLQFSIPIEQLRTAALKHFSDLSLSEISSSRFLADAGRAGRKAEVALLKGDAAEAFREAQRREFAFMYAREAKKLEKERSAFEKTAKRFRQREVSGVDQEYTNWIHDILLRTGNGVNRTVQDLQNSLATRSESRTLADFVDSKSTYYLREVPVAEFLLDPNFRKDMKALTATEFRGVKAAVDTLVKNGRSEMRVTKAGEEADLAAVRKEMVEQIQQLPQIEYDAKGERQLAPYLPPKGAKAIRKFGVAHLQVESVFNRMDKGNPWGIFNQYVMRDLISGANSKDALERKYARIYRELGDYKIDTKKYFPDVPFMDPYSVERGTPMPLRMNEENLLAVILNMGNESNFDKLARGYGVDPTKIQQWVFQHSTKEHWDWAQKFGDIFQKFKDEESDPLYRRLSGIEPEAVQIAPIDTPFGQYKGWYYPVIYHPLFEGTSRVLMGGDALEGSHYVRATTPHGYVMKRTGYAGPIDLGLDRAPSRLKQMIHDVAMREAVINASKVFYDSSVRNAIARHMNQEIRDMLVPYLKDVANASAVKNELRTLDSSIGESVRQNLISVLVGMNPGTIAKHGLTALVQSMNEVGSKDFLRAAASMTTKDDHLAESNWQFALKSSEELQRRMRNYQEVLRGGSEQLFAKPKWRDVMIHAGSYAVGKADLLSAVPTWLAQYAKTMEETGQHGDAVYMADRAVRRAHGSTAITNRPSVMREGNLWFTSLYGFFNHIMNRQYETSWKAVDALNKPGVDEQGMRLTKTPDGTYVPEHAKTGAKAIPMLTSAVMAYVMFPALIEEMVTPTSSDKKEGWGKWAAKALTKDLSSSWVYARDIADAVLNGRDPSAGILSTAYKTLTDVARDMNRDRPFSRQHLGSMIQHGITLFGTVTGLTNQQMGRDAKFMYNYLSGQEHPRGLKDWYRGLRYGTTKERK